MKVSSSARLLRVLMIRHEPLHRNGRRTIS
jgi:hypothetical protein